MAADDAQLGELERDVVEIRNRPSWFRGRKRSRVTDLQAEWDVELDALCIESEHLVTRWLHQRVTPARIVPLVVHFSR